MAEPSILPPKPRPLPTRLRTLRVSANRCPACAGDLGETGSQVLAHLARHDEEAAELVAAALSEESLLAVLHDAVRSALSDDVPFPLLSPWIRARVHEDVYEDARSPEAQVGQSLSATQDAGMTAPISIDPSSLELRAFEPPPFDLAELDRLAEALRHGDRAELTLSGPLGAEAAGLLLQEVGHKLKAMDSLRLVPIPGGVAVLRIGSD